MVTRPNRAPVQVMANGHNVTDKMPLTAAVLESQRPPDTTANVDLLTVGAPIPKSIGRCADLYSDVRSLRLAMDKEVDAVKAREAEIREYIINNLSKSDDTGASGLKYRAQIVPKHVAKVNDWQLLWAFIAKHNRFDLLQKRLGETACRDMIDAGETPPGVEDMLIPEVSITKI